MNFKFYIFGVPEGFDIYSGDADDTRFFQGYYDGSTETAKLTIQRIGRHVSYSYLRYNLVSGGGRAGAFFGMSVAFDGMYCSDVTNLYKLFDAVYGTIIQSGRLLKDINGQTRFEILAFKDAGGEIKRIENLIRKNIESQFTDDFIKTDDTFKQGVNQNLLKKLDIDKGNKAITAMSKEYPLLSVSPEYKEKEIEVKVISQKELRDLSMNVDNLEKAVTELQTEYDKIKTMLTLRQSLTDRQQQIPYENNIVKIYDDLNKGIKNIYEEYNAWQDKVRQYLQSQKEHPVLRTYNKFFEDGKGALKNLHESVQMFTPVVKQFGGNIQSNDGRNSPVEFFTQQQGGFPKDNHGDNCSGTNTDTEGNGLLPPPQSPKKQKSNIKIIKIFVIIILVFMALAILKILFSGKPNTATSSNCPECFDLLNAGDNLLTVNEFDGAIRRFEQAQSKGADAGNKINEAKQKANKFHTDKAKNNANNNPRDALLEYRTAARYGAVNTQDTLDLRVRIHLEKAEEYMQKKDYKKVIEFCDYVLEDSPNNQEAIDLKEKARQKPAQDKNLLPQQQPAVCTIKYRNRPWKIDDLLSQLDKDLKDKGVKAIEFVQNGCQAVIDSECATKQQKDRAEELKNNAKNTKPAESAF
jgi:hypothetical protein